MLVLSLGAAALLYVLIRRGAAAQVASLSFLVPVHGTHRLAALRRNAALRGARRDGLAALAVGWPGKAQQAVKITQLRAGSFGADGNYVTARLTLSISTVP